MSINEKASFPFYSFIKSYKQDPLTIRNYHFIISFIVLGYPFISMKEMLTVSICIRQVKIRNKWPDRKKIANKRFIADLC